MKSKSLFFSSLLIYLLPFSLLLTFFANKNPFLTETLYSKGIYKVLSKVLSFIARFLPISIGELLTYAVILLLLLKGIKFVHKIFWEKSNVKELFLDNLLHLFKFISLLYFLFILIWGLNYHRLPFSSIADLKTQPASIEVLESLCRDLIIKVNTLRENVLENKQGVTYIPNGFKSVFQRAYKGFSISADKYPELGGKLSPPKGVLTSQAMSYAGISGIYFPFTGEANVNVLIPDAMLPNTACHEMAHQRGFAREDEANYIAYLVCTKHPDYDFQYSGNLLALIHSMNTLYKYDAMKYNQLAMEYSSGLKRDLAFIDHFWDSYQGPLERASSKINNVYLKSNLQEEGTQSYGRMVDLLIAEYLEEKKKDRR